jgi:diaminopimelate epimerase
MHPQWAAWAGHPFAKVCGSGNDFVLFDHVASAQPVEIPHELIRAITNRRNGIGADGVVQLVRETDGALRVVYFNADGSRGELCGNATLCSAAWSVARGYVAATGFRLGTDAGWVDARVDADGTPSIDLAPVHEVAPVWRSLRLLDGVRTMGFARVGVPHVVSVVDDVDLIPLEDWGPAIRSDAQLQQGANANFISPGASPDRWRIRTWERGVEGETLACGSGAVAAALLIGRWAASGAGGPVALETRSGRTLRVSPGVQADGSWRPTLFGEGRVVFEGRIGALA